MSDKEPWSTRNIAEYAYCPRLFYFMEVEGVFVPSADTEAGISAHRRADNPSAIRADEGIEADEDQERPKVVRSVVLASNSLGITARLDLIEITGSTAVPVEYRKGRSKRMSVSPPPDDPGEAEEEPPLSTPAAWPTDRVQVGFQCLLLEEAGYSVNKAVIYYASEKLRLTIPFDDRLRSESLKTLEEAKACAAGPRPLPLVNDSRCVRCSLQPICLPDEINQQRAEQPSENLTPRRMWPPRDDGIHVVAQIGGCKIGIVGPTLRVSDKKGQTIKDVPLSNIESVSLLGGVQISTQALHALSDREIPVAFLSAAGRLITMTDPMNSVSAHVRRAQVRKFDDPNVCLKLAQALVEAKILNQRTILMRNHPALPDNVSKDMAIAADDTAKGTSLDAVRGHEGRAAALYFANFPGAFKGSLGAEFDVNGRKRRPPPDPINACLSMAYSMLTKECIAALRLAGLEPSIGAFHAPRPGRPALALDLMEPFRPIIADSVAIAAFNRGELVEGHFHRTVAGCAFTDHGRRAFFNAYGRRMDTEVTHKVFGYRLSYRRMLMLHARMIAAWLMDEIPTLEFLTTR